MNIRMATAGDEQIIHKIHKHSVQCGCSGHYSSEQIASWAVRQGLPPFEELLAKRIFAVAENEDGKCVGFGSADKTQSRIVTLFVDPNYFGEGVGSGLLAFLEENLAKSGCSRVFIDSSLNAVGFYEKNGYHVDSDTAHTEPDGTVLECVVVVKEI